MLSLCAFGSRLHRSKLSRSALCWAVVSGSLTACDPHNPRFRLTRTESVNVPVPAADGPELGAIAQATPIRSRPEAEAPVLGYLHAGARVRRAEEAVSQADCQKGWYPIRPRGFVCLSEGATLDLNHPTLVTMATQPELTATLPYAYARTRSDAPLYAVDDAREGGVQPDRSVTSRSGMAVVGSWDASTTPQGPKQAFAMMTNGRFLQADNLEQAAASGFHGLSLSESQRLPVAFVITPDAHSYTLTASTSTSAAPLAYHTAVRTTGKSQSVNGVEFRETSAGSWLKSSDVTLAEPLKEQPPLAKSGQRWLDISVSRQTLVAYQGTEPVYATLVSTGKSKPNQPRDTLSGEFSIVAKHITALNAQVQGFADRVEIFDAPWPLELSSGQLLHGAFWHDKFGQPHGLGHVQLAPADAHFIWKWVGAPVPDGWHAVVVGDPTEESESAALKAEDTDSTFTGHPARVFIRP